MLGADHLPLGAHIAFDARVGARRRSPARSLVGIAIGVPIAWYTLREPLGDRAALRVARRTASRAAQRLRHGFIVAQIALAFVLLAGAGLLGLSLKRPWRCLPASGPTTS